MRLMVIAPRFPYPLDKGDRLTVFNLLKHFSRRHRLALVTFLEPGQDPDDRRHFEGWVEEIHTLPLSRARAYGGCLAGGLSRRPLQTCYYRDPRMAALVARAVESFRPDLIYAHTIRVGEYPLPHRAGRTTVLAMQIAMTLNYGRLASFARQPASRLFYGLEHRKVARYEPWIARQYDRCLLISPADLAALGPGVDNVFFSPHGVDFEHFSPPEARQPEPGLIVFTGNMGYAPNVDAVLYFAAEILPLIRADMPEARLAVVGTDPAPAVRRLAEQPGIEVTGRVPDLRPWLARAAVAIDPLRIGAGLQNKVLEGMAMALPMVITTIANEGIGARPDQEVLVADAPAAFAAAVTGLLRDPARARTLGDAARAFIVGSWSWEKHFLDLEAEFERLAGTAPCGSAP